MRLYRVVQLAYAMDLSGEGARLYGGRWTPPGVPAIYTAEHPALCAFELLVHNGIGIINHPLGFRLIGIDLPDNTSVDHISAMPSVPRYLGARWVTEQHSALLRVPSALMPHSWNILLNPQHPEAANAKAVDLGLVPFDPRISGP